MSGPLQDITDGAGLPSRRDGRDDRSRPDGHASATAGSLPVGKVFEAFPLTREHFKSCFALFFVFVIEAWEMMIIVYSAPLISKDFNLSAVALGNLIGAIFVGMAIGSVFWGPVADKVGRKKATIWSLVLYGVISMCSAFAPDYGMLYVLRLLSGIAAAGMIVVCFPYFEELLPIRSRGTLTVYLAAGWPIGVLLAVGATVWLMPYGWRWIIGVSSLGGLWAIVVALCVQESPYWLVGAGQQQKAREVISRLSRGAVVLSAAQTLSVDRAERGAIREVFKGRMLVITLLQIAINFTFSWGYWGLQTWLPALLQQRGLSLPQSYSFIAISALFMIPGYVCSSYLTGKFGRKKVVTGFVALSAVAGYAFATAQSINALYVSNFVLVFFSLGAWGVWDAWVAELYPTRIRTAGYSWAVFAQRIANIVAPGTIGLLVAGGASFNLTTTFIDLFLVATVILALFLPETEGKKLA
jgi:putative MFS transporter